MMITTMKTSSKTNSTTLIEPALTPLKDCKRCARLVAHRNDLQRAHPIWHNAPVADFGDPQARLMIIGLAPGQSGANRTGRIFTGDASGAFLFAALERAGRTRGTYGGHAADGVQLTGVRITNAVACLPPGNKPTAAEFAACRRNLAHAITSLANVKAVLCLGREAHRQLCRLAGRPLSALPFGHGNRHDILIGGRTLSMFDSYHCSRYNTRTGRLTEAGFDRVLNAALNAC